MVPPLVSQLQQRLQGAASGAEAEGSRAAHSLATAFICVLLELASQCKSSSALPRHRFFDVQHGLSF